MLVRLLFVKVKYAVQMNEKLNIAGFFFCSEIQVSISMNIFYQMLLRLRDENRNRSGCILKFNILMLETSIQFFIDANTYHSSAA